MIQVDSNNYNAFLSYNQREHQRLASDVQNILHSIARPWYRLRALRVFRDKSSIIPTESLWGGIVAALQQSEYFVLLASPGAVTSPWVTREVAWWLEHHGIQNFIILVGSGDVIWNEEKCDFDHNLSTAIPSILFGKFVEQPFWVNISFATSAKRGVKDRLQADLLPLAARLHGKSPDVLGGEDLRRRRTTYSLWATFGMLAIIGFATALIIAREADVKTRLADANAKAQRMQIQSAENEKQMQRLRAEKEALNRIASLASQSVTNSGVSALAVAQLAYVAQKSIGVDEQRHLFALSYWMQYMVPAPDLFKSTPIANWWDNAYFFNNGEIITLEGGRKTTLAFSDRKPVIYAVDEVRKRFSIMRKTDGRETISIDFSKDNIDAGSIKLYELANGNAVLLAAQTEELSAGDVEDRLLVMSLDGNKTGWLSPSLGQSTQVKTFQQFF